MSWKSLKEYVFQEYLFNVSLLYFNCYYLSFVILISSGSYEILPKFDLNYICLKLYTKFQDFASRTKICLLEFSVSVLLGPREEHEITGDTYSITGDTWRFSLHPSLSSTCHCPIFGLCLIIGLICCLKLYSNFQDLFSRIIFFISPCCTWTYTICIPILVGRSETLISLSLKQRVSSCTTTSTILKLIITGSSDILKIFA